MNPEGGPAHPVVVVDDAPIGGPAVPVYGVDDGRPVQGGPARRVKVLTDSDLVANGGRYYLEGRAKAMPVALVEDGRPTVGPVIAVYPVNDWPPEPEPEGLLLDQFTTAEAMPIALPRDAEPGPGEWTGAQSEVEDSAFEIVGGKLVYPATGADDVTYIGSGPYTRAAGVALYFMAMTRNTMTGSRPIFGWSEDALINSNGGGVQQALTFNTTALRAIVNIASASASAGWTIVSYTAATAYDYVIILRASGAHILRKLSSDSTYNRLWVASAGNVADLYAGFNCRDGGGEIDTIEISQLEGDFATEYGTATFRDSTPTTGDVATGTADAFIEFTWTPQVGETFELSFRRTDDNNRWIIRCIQASNVIRLIEVNAGAETLRNSAAQTWTAGTPFRVTVSAIGQTIRSFVANVAKNAITNGAFNLTETGQKVSGFTTGAEFISWPSSGISL